VWKWLDTPIPLVVVLVLYLIQAVGYVRTQQYGMAIAFVAYALANVGFILAWKGH
jgi:hypothetical protein